MKKYLLWLVRKGIVIVGVLLLLVGCSAPFNSDEEIARQELLELAPIDSDARDAKEKLERKGLQCQWFEQREFYGLEGKHDYLYCDKEKVVGVLVNRRWQLALIHKDYLVADAKVGIGLIGL